MKSKKFVGWIVTLALLLVMSACSSGNSKTVNQSNQSSSEKTTNMSNTDSSAALVPKGIKAAKNPTYKVGSQVIVKADHMKGMYGAKGTIAGAYDTTVYAVTYTPTTGGPVVKNHKWVVQEEIKNAGNQTLKTGTKVTLEADHMKGMMGAKAIIDYAEKTTVYMINYTPTTGGPEVKNHKWVVESELSSK